MSECKICGSKKTQRRYLVKEMMFGFDENFEYVKCQHCGCLQIKRPPKDMSKYYPKNYYSFAQVVKSDNFLLSFVRKRRAEYGLLGKGLVGEFTSKFSNVPEFYKWFRKVKVNFDSSIFDVGCGNGHFLLVLKKEGFNNLIGIDPYIETDIVYKNGIKVLKKDLSDMEGQFDFIMLNHSFEHMAKPISVLKELNRLLKPDRYLMIRTPVVPCHAFRKYGINWVQLDAPRHQFIYSKKGLEILASMAGLQLTDVVYDSTAFQFWGSEQYLRGIHLRDSNSYSQNPEVSIFSKKDISSFKKKAFELNKKEDGDQAVFYLYKTSEN